MKVIQYISLFSLVVVIHYCDAGPVEDYYCEPIDEPYPVIYGKMEILSSSPRVQICPQGCSTSMTKKTWTAYEFKKDGKTNVKEFYAYSAKECNYDGFGKILG